MTIQDIKKAHAALYSRPFRASSDRSHVSVPIAELGALHKAIMAAQAAPTEHPDRTAIAAQMLAAGIAGDLDRRHLPKDQIQLAIAYADALLYELSTPCDPVAAPVPDRDPHHALADRAAELDADTCDAITFSPAPGITITQTRLRPIDDR